MTDIVERLQERATNGDGWTRPVAVNALAEIERLRDIEAAYELNQKNSYRAIMMWEEAHNARASGIHEVDLLTWLLDEVERLRAGLRQIAHSADYDTIISPDGDRHQRAIEIALETLAGSER